MTVRVEISTNEYPEEVRYILRDEVAKSVVASVPLGTFDSPGAVEVQSYDLVAGREYTFHISDSSADGLAGYESYKIVAEGSAKNIVLVNGKGRQYGHKRQSFVAPQLTRADQTLDSDMVGSSSSSASNCCIATLSAMLSIIFMAL